MYCRAAIGNNGCVLCALSGKGAVLMERPILTLDLLGPDGNVFIAIARARALLTGQMLEHFNMDIGQAMLINVGTTYRDILAIVNKYLRLIDTSGTYSEYAISRDEVMAA